MDIWFWNNDVLVMACQSFADDGLPCLFNVAYLANFKRL